MIWDSMVSSVVTKRLLRGFAARNDVYFYFFKLKKMTIDLRESIYYSCLPRINYINLTIFVCKIPVNIRVFVIFF